MAAENTRRTGRGTRRRHRMGRARQAQTNQTNHTDHGAMKAPMTFGYARYVGRVGALAVALGVGAAMATGQGLGLPMAWAEETGTSDDASTDPGPAADPGPADPGAAEPPAADPPAPIDEGADEDPDAAVDDDAYVPDMNVEGGVDTETEEETAEQAPPDSEVVSPPPPADPPAAPGNEGPPAGAVPQGISKLPEPQDPDTDGVEEQNLNTTPDLDPPAQQRMAMVVDDGVDAAGGASLMLSAAAPGTPAPAPLVDQPDNLFEGVLGAPVALANIAVTAVTAFLTSIFAPGPTTPAPPVMLFVVLGWVQRELQRTFNNQSPTAVVDTVTTAEDTGVDIAVLVTETDPDINTGPSVFPGDTVTVTDYTQPANGAVVLNPDGVFTYTPDANFNGTDTFTYTVSDEASPWHLHGLGGLFFGGAHTSTTTVTVTVTPVNDAPVAGDDAFTLDEDTTFTLPSATGSLLDNDTDVETPNPLDLEIVSYSPPANGTVILSPDGSFVYTPDANFFGTDTFTYTVWDDGGMEDTATVTMTVNPVDDVPDAVDDVATTGEDNSVVINVVANDGAPDGGLTVVAASDPAHGSVFINGADGTITYTPDADFDGTDTFTYTVFDGGTATDSATVTVEVTPAITVALTWGMTPADLDAHLTGPSVTDTEGPQFHVYWASQNYLTDGTSTNNDADPRERAAFLLADDFDGGGPEHMEINTRTPGHYLYYVENPFVDGALGNSAAVVTVTDPLEGSATYTVDPTATERYWAVFVLTISELGTSMVTPLHEYSDTVPTLPPPI